MSGRGYRFVAPVTEIAAEDGLRPLLASPLLPPAQVEVAGPAGAAPWPRDLPRPLTTLIGRDGDLDRVESRLRESRLVTVVGAGGVGKTRLILAVADRARRSYANGAWFADLGPVEEPRLVAATIASALGVDVGGGEALRVVIAALTAKRGLLVLDGANTCCVRRPCRRVDPAKLPGHRDPGNQPRTAPRRGRAAAPVAASQRGGARYHDHRRAARRLPRQRAFVERACAALGAFVPGDADAGEIMCDLPSGWTASRSPSSSPSRHCRP